MGYDDQVALHKLRDRLRSVGSVRLAPPPAYVQNRAEGDAGLADLAHDLGAAVQSRPEGRYLTVTSEFAADHRHGRSALAEALGAEPETVGLLAREPRPGGLTLAQAVFLDIETTGLVGGTGTSVFLVGLGRFREGRLAVTQHFLPGPADEAAFVAGLIEALGDRSLLVTYNGKRFDAPMLQTRFTLQRRRVPLHTWPHLDLLYPARSLYRPRVPDCCLGTVEEHVLGVRRTEEDIPGYLIPSIYFDYLRTGAAAPLKGVFYHNLMDILSLAALAGAVTAAVEGRRVGHPLDHLGAGRIWEAAGDRAVAGAAYRRAADGATGPHRRLALWRLAWLLKRQGESAAAGEIWRALVDAGADHDGAAHVELAKYLEHKARDHAAAAEVVRRAMALPAAQATGMMEPLAHRLARLEAKLARQNGRR